jgi:hypothetical protein
MIVRLIAARCQSGRRGFDVVVRPTTACDGGGEAEAIKKRSKQDTTSNNRTYDSVETAHLLAAIVRQNASGWSREALRLLVELRTLYSLKELVELMDVPDGRAIGQTDRETLWSAVREQAAKLDKAADMPEYDPRGSKRSRGLQKRAWLKWLENIDSKIA